MSFEHQAFRFRVALLGIEPAVWRTVDVPASYNFWSLHVAIQDAMGWLDCHLHTFRVESGGKTLEIGIPDDLLGMRDVSPGWDVPLSAHLDQLKTGVMYEYDFGDGWEHTIQLEEVVDLLADYSYPRCLDGAQACPPEDCGGVHGYQLMLEVLKDPRHERHHEMIEWIGGKYDPDIFDPAKVKFDDPNKRWETAFAGR